MNRKEWDTIKAEEISYITIEAELIMYGLCQFQLFRTNNGIEISYSSCADGGIVIDEGKTVQKKMDFDKLLSEIKSVPAFYANDENIPFVWKIRFLSLNSCCYWERDSSLCSIDSLKTIVNTIEDYLENKQVLEDLNEMLKTINQ